MDYAGRSILFPKRMICPEVAPFLNNPSLFKEDMLMSPSYTKWFSVFKEILHEDKCLSLLLFLFLPRKDTSLFLVIWALISGR